MNNENNRILSLMGFYTEKLKNGSARYFYQNQFTGEITELTEYEYFMKADRVIRAADTIERISKN